MSDILALNIVASRKDVAAILTTATDLDKLDSASKKATQAGRDLADAFGTKLAAQFAIVDRAVGLVFRGMQAFAHEAIVARAEYERLMVQVRTLTTASTADIERFNKAVGGIAASTGRGPNELAKTFYFVASAGLAGAEALEVTKVSAQAAAIGMGEASTVARTLTAAMIAYGPANLSAAKAAEQMLQAIRLGNVEAPELAGSLGRVIPIAAQLGVSFAELTTFIAFATKTGLNADEAATSLRGALSALAAPGKEARDTLGEMGITVQQLHESIKGRGLGATLQDLSDRFHGNFEALDKVIPNVRALTGVLAVTGAQAKEYAAGIKSTEEAHGQMADSMAKTAETVSLQWDRIVAASKTGAQEMGAAWQGPIAGLLKLLNMGEGRFATSGGASAVGLMSGPLWQLPKLGRDIKEAWDAAAAAIRSALSLGFYSAQASMPLAGPPQPERMLPGTGVTLGGQFGFELPGGPLGPGQGVRSDSGLGGHKKILTPEEIKQALKDRFAREELIGKALEAQLKIMQWQSIEAYELAGAEKMRKEALATEIALAIEKRRVAAAYSGRLLEGDMLFGSSGLFTRHQDVIDQELENANDGIREATKHTIDWASAFEDVGRGVLDVAQAIGGALGGAIAGIGGALLGLAAFERQAAANFEATGSKAMTTNQKVTAAASMFGPAVDAYRSGSVGQGAAGGAAAGSAFGPYGIAIGAFVGGFLGLLGGDALDAKAREAGNLLGRTVSVAYAKELAQGAKAAGMSFDAFVKKIKEQEALAAAVQKYQDVRSGLATAQAGLDAIYKALPELADTPALHAAIAIISQKVADAMAKSGLGYMLTGSPLAKDKTYMAATEAGAGAGQVLAGMREAGFVDTGLTSAMGGLAEELKRQAYDAAIAAGLSPTEATKAGFGAVVPILTEQLNNSLATGQALDAKTQTLIDEARAAGIFIVGHPLLVANDIARDQLTELRAINAALLGPGSEYKPPPGTKPPPDWKPGDKVPPPPDRPPGYPPHLPWPPTSAAVGYFSSRALDRDTMFLAHAGEHVFIAPKRMAFVSAARGYGDDWEPREGGSLGGGGGTVTPPGGGDSIGDDVRALVQELRSRTPNVTVNTQTVVAPTIDPSMSVQTQQDAVDLMVDGVERAIRQGKPSLVSAIRRAVGQSR